MEGKGPVGEGEKKESAGSVVGFVWPSGVTGRWPVLGTAAVLSPRCHVAIVAWAGSSGRLRTLVDRLLVLHRLGRTEPQVSVYNGRAG